MEELIQRAGYLRHISRTRAADILQWFVQSRVIAFGYFQMFPAFGSPYANQTSNLGVKMFFAIDYYCVTAMS